MSALAIFLGLAAAGLYGSSDFAGGDATRRASVVWVLVISQSAGLVVAVVATALDWGAQPTTQALVRGALGGAAGVVGLALLYSALARGPMGVMAPTAAVVGALVPVGWGLLRDEAPSAAAFAGVGLVVVAIALVVGPSADPGVARGVRSWTYSGVPLAVAAGVAFGSILVLLARLPAAVGAWPLVSWRLASIPLALLGLMLRRPGRRPDRGTLRLAVLAGVLEVAGNGCYLIAAREQLTALVGVIGSMYPVMTVLLARIVLHERLGRMQWYCFGFAIAGIMLIARG